MSERDPRLERRRPTSAELDRDAEVTESDVDDAMDAWRKYAPPEAKGVLDAQPVEE